MRRWAETLSKSGPTAYKTRTYLSVIFAVLTRSKATALARQPHKSSYSFPILNTKIALGLIQSLVKVALQNIAALQPWNTTALKIDASSGRGFGTGQKKRKHPFRTKKSKTKPFSEIS